MEDLNFESFLGNKKIDHELFLRSEPIIYADWQRLFNHVHSNSFVAQKKFLINSIRRKYPKFEK